MLLDIARLLRPGAEPLEGRLTADMSYRDFAGYTVPAPAEAVYALRPHGQRLLLRLKVQAELQTECARCLKPAACPLLVKREYWIRREDLEDEYPELPILDGGRLDMDELVYGEIVMEAPPAVLCRDDCPGLCQACGMPAGTCGCWPDEPTDPRLQVLRQLLDGDKDSQ